MSRRCLDVVAWDDDSRSDLDVRLAVGGTVAGYAGASTPTVLMTLMEPGRALEVRLTPWDARDLAKMLLERASEP